MQDYILEKTPKGKTDNLNILNNEEKLHLTLKIKIVLEWEPAGLILEQFHLEDLFKTHQFVQFLSWDFDFNSMHCWVSVVSCFHDINLVNNKKADN